MWSVVKDSKHRAMPYMVVHADGRRLGGYNNRGRRWKYEEMAQVEAQKANQREARLQGNVNSTLHLEKSS